MSKSRYNDGQNKKIFQNIMEIKKVPTMMAKYLRKSKMLGQILKKTQKYITMESITKSKSHQVISILDQQKCSCTAAHYTAHYFSENRAQAVRNGAAASVGLGLPTRRVRLSLTAMLPWLILVLLPSKLNTKTENA